MSKEWYLPTGRTADEFMAEMKGNLRHDAEHLFGRIRQADKRIAALEAAICRHQESFNLREDEPTSIEYGLWKALEQDDER
jgi:hypothetical protein